MNLTVKEQTALNFIANMGLDCMGGSTKTHLKEDNMAWFDSTDLMNGLKISRFEAAGIMSALDAKGLAFDSGEGVNGRGPNQWCITDDGINFAEIPD